MKPITRELKDFLTKIVDDIDYNYIYLDYIPDIDNNTISIMTTGGFNSYDGYIDQPTFQIFLRHKDYDEGYILINNIKRKIKGNFITKNRYILNIKIIGDINYLGRNGKYKEYSINIAILNKERY